MKLKMSWEQVAHFAYRGKALLRYALTAKSRYWIHSPFVYDFVSYVLYGQLDEVSQQKAKSYRKALAKDQSPLLKTNQGANSNRLQPSRKTVAQEAIKSGIAHKHGRMLFNLVRHYRCCNVLELGTSLGIGTTYLALGQQTLPERKLISLEGCPYTHAKALEHFQDHWHHHPEFNHVTLEQGRFGEKLPVVLKQFDQLDLLFLDGDHRYDAVLLNFQACYEKATPESVFVIDDIHWSTGMEESWQAIQQMPEVTLTIDLFQMGVVFFNPRLSKEHFVLWH